MHTRDLIAYDTSIIIPDIFYYLINSKYLDSWLDHTTTYYISSFFFADSPDDRADTAGKGSPTSLSSSFAFNSGTLKGGLDSKDSVESPQENTAPKDIACGNGGFGRMPQIRVEEIHEVKAEIHSNENDVSRNEARVEVSTDEREETRM